MTALFALLVAGLALAQPAPTTDEAEAITQALRAAQTLGRDNTAEITAVAAAYEDVFTLPGLSADQRLRAHLELARCYAVRGQFDAAAAAYDRSAAAADLTPAQRCTALSAKAKMWFDSNFQGAFASYTTEGIERAAAVYQQIIALPDCPNPEKIAAYQGVANCQLEMHDIAAANRTLDRAANLSDLSELERVTAKKQQADALYRQLAYDDALARYRQLWSEKLPGGLKAPIEERTLAILVGQHRHDDARQALRDWQRPASSLAHCYLDTGRPAEAQRLYVEILADPKQRYQDRCDALDRLLQLHVARKDLTAFYAEAERRIPALIAENERAWALYPRLLGWAYTRHGVANAPEYQGWVAERILRTPHITPDEYVKYGDLLLNAHLRRRDRARAKDVIARLLAKELTAPNRLRYQLIQAVLDANGKAHGIVETVDAVLMERAGARSEPRARAEALIQAAKTAMTTGDEAVARALYSAHETMRAPLEPRSLSCTFLPNGPRDITGFLQSDYFKDAKAHGRLDRKYGDTLQFLLETDSALTGRTVTAQRGHFTPTEFVAACDADGLQLFFFAPTARAREIADGFAALGGYEIYLSAGVNEPYHCYLVDSAPGTLSDNFVTQYNNRHFRRARQQEGTARIEHAVLPNGVATLLSVSWNAFFDKLPRNGERWAFEAIHWEQGGYSWGGSESVHHRSSFGKLVFANLTSENLRAIKRRLITHAAGVYRRELSPKNGAVEIWQDPELGDRQFYAEVVKPLQATLDGYLATVTPDMTAEEVDLLYAEAVPRWMNITYLLADLRRDYLDDRRMRGL